MGLMDFVREKYHAMVKKENAETIIDRIMYGSYILKNPVCEPGVKEVLKKIRRQLYESETDLDRVKLISENFSKDNLIYFMKNIDLDMVKSDVTASNFKEKAYECFEMFHYEMAIRCCNLALMFAPSGSTLLPSLHADRVMCLHTLNDLEPVIKDVDVALELAHDFTDELKAVLIRMKRESLRFQNNLNQNLPDSETQKRHDYSDFTLFNVFEGPSLKIPGAGNFIKIADHPVKGRMLVATQDLAAGTTVIVEDPFVSAMTESVNWELKHCAKCYRKTRALVPCPDCIHTTYCSDECRSSDYELIHKYECPCLNFLHAIHAPASLQLAFRTACKMGPESLFQFSIKESDSPWREQLKRDTGRYDSKYAQIYNLASHPGRQHLELHTWYSVALVKLLDMKTTFFETIDPKDKTTFMDFVASCILRHSRAFAFNTTLLWEAEKLAKLEDTKKSNNSTPDRYGRLPALNGVFALSSLICHSCEASALRVNLMNGKLAIVTRRRVKAGEEISNTYGYEFSTDKLKCRSAALEKDFCFKCDCVACTCKWPTEDMIGPKVEYLCPECTNKSTYEETILTRKCVLIVQKSTGLGTCLKCNKEFKMKIFEGNLEKHKVILQMAKRMVVDDNPVDAVPFLLECIEYFQFHVLSPFIPLIQAQSFLVCAYDAIAKNSRV